MGLPYSCVFLNAACPSEPLLCLLDRTGLRVDGAQGPSESKPEPYMCVRGLTQTARSQQANAAILQGALTLHWIRMLQHAKHPHLK